MNHYDGNNKKFLRMTNLEKAVGKHTNMAMKKCMTAGWMKWENNEQEVASMAIHDWNHDGRKGFTDDFIEYQIYKDSASNNNYTPRSGGGISTFGAIAATIGGLFLAAAIVALFGG